MVCYVVVPTRQVYYAPVGRVCQGANLSLLHKARRNAKIPIRQVAQRMGVALSTIQRWEAGDPLPRLDELAALAAIYGVPVESLLDDTVASTSKMGEQVSFAAGILWTIMQDAEHLADKARKAHKQLMRSTPL